MSVLQVSPTFPANITENDVILSYLPLAHIFDRYLVSMLCMLPHLKSVCLSLSCMHHRLGLTASPAMLHGICAHNKPVSTLSSNFLYSVMF